MGDSRGVIDNCDGENGGLDSQIREKEGKIAKKDYEIKDLKDQITQRVARGEDLKRTLDGLERDNVRLKEQKG